MTGIDFNFTALVIGPQRYGKTNEMKKITAAHLSEYPTGLALIHDPNRQFDDVCAVYEDAAAWRKAFDAACASGQPFPRGASIGGLAKDVREAAITLGKSRNVAKNVRIPILLGIDESSLMGTSSSTHISDEDNALISNRAHWGIGPMLIAQRVGALHAAWYANATLVILFAQVSERETAKAEERLGLPDGTLSDLVMAPKYRHRRWEVGKGLV